MIYITHKKGDKEERQEILTVMDGMTWSGATDKCCRTLTFNILYNPLKSDIPTYNMTVGDKVEWEEDKLLFLGYIEKLSYSSENDYIEVTCQDLAARLQLSKCHGRFAGTLVELANNICGQFNLKNGIESDSTLKHNIVSTGDMTFYEVLKTAGETVFGKENFAYYMDGNTLKLAESEPQNTFEEKLNIRHSVYEFSIDKLKTQMIVLGDNDSYMTTKTNARTYGMYGLFQDTYNWDKDCKDNWAKIEDLLKEPDRKATIICNNDNNCIAGRYVTVKESVNGYEGTFKILTDSHTIQTDSQMTLTLKVDG